MRHLRFPKIPCLTLTLFVLLSSLPAGSNPPCLFASPAAKSVFFAQAARESEMARPCCSWRWGCWWPSAMPSQGQSARCRSGANKCTLPGKTWGAMSAWASPSPWLRKPCLFFHLWILVLFVLLQGKTCLTPPLAGQSLTLLDRRWGPSYSSHYVYM